jgi:hypothetical protein
MSNQLERNKQTAMAFYDLMSGRLTTPSRSRSGGDRRRP